MRKAFLDLDQDLQNLQDVGIKVAGSIYDFFRNGDNIKILKELESLGVNLKSSKKEVIQGNLSGQTFLFTGTLPTLQRSEAENMVEKNGGQLLPGVNSKLNYLIVGEDAGSKLEKAKKIKTIKIFNEDEFLELIKS